MSIFLGVFVLFLAIYLWIGIRASQGIKTINDYFLMDRSLTLLPLAMTLFATILGGGVLVGAAQAAWRYGIYVILYPLGTFVGLAILGTNYGRKLRNMKLTTLPELVGKVYQCKSLRFITACVVVASLFLIFTAQGITVKFLFNSMEISSYYFYFFWLIFIAYTVMGGFKAVVQTDVVQGLFILLGLIFILFFLDLKEIERAVYIPQWTGDFQLPWSTWFLMPLCYVLIGQDLGQRFFAAKSEKVILPACLISAILLLICCTIVILLGLLSKSSSTNISLESEALFAFVRQNVPKSISAIFIACLLMAVLSTVDSILNAISSVIFADLMKNKNQDNKQKISRARKITFILGIAGLVVATQFTAIIDVLMVSYQLSVYILFWPIVLGVILTKPSKKGAVLSMASGAFVGIVFSCFRLGIYQDWVVLSISMIAYFIGYYIDVKENKALKAFLPNSSGQLTIGIIGGAGPMAGVLLCEYIIQLCQQRYQCKDDADFPKIVLLSIPFAQMLKTDRVDNTELAVRKQLSNALSSVSALAGKIGIACNTLHGFIEQSQLQKICNMVQLTSLYIKNKSIQTPLVLGTSTSLLKNVHNFDGAVYPCYKNQIKLDKVIDSILSGKKSQEARQQFDEIVTACLSQNKSVDGIVLACTELSVLLKKNCRLKQAQSRIQYIDPLWLLAEELTYDLGEK